MPGFHKRISKVEPTGFAGSSVKIGKNESQECHSGQLEQPAGPSCHLRRWEGHGEAGWGEGVEMAISCEVKASVDISLEMPRKPSMPASTFGKCPSWTERCVKSMLSGVILSQRD